MVLKVLSELAIVELKSEVEKAGNHEVFSESLALVKLTIYLVSIGEDPFTFLFDIPVEEGIEDKNDSICEFEGKESKSLPSEKLFVSSLGIADGVSARVLSDVLPSTETGFQMSFEASLSLNDSSEVSLFTLSCTKDVIEDQERIEFEEEAIKERPCEEPFTLVLGFADDVSAGSISKCLPSSLYFLSFALDACLSSTWHSSILSFIYIIVSHGFLFNLHQH